MMKTKVNLGIIQETLLIPLWARAAELQQQNPIIIDPKSAEILESIDYNFDKFATSQDSQVGCCIRGMILDNWVRNYLEKYPQCTVIEIGAGLNTRFERVDNGKVRWFDLDLPDSMAVRKQFFTETERRRFITASALDTDWIAEVKSVSNEPCLFVAEGVLMYLSEVQVKELFANLLEHFPSSSFVFDSMSPFMVKNQKHHDSIKYTSAKFDWGIADIHLIEKWNPRYQVAEVFRFTNLSSQYLQRFSLKTRFFCYVPFLQDFYRLALVQF
ncbi:class I SAM-dependent methyltransferase [Cronbergia sp. UHCC 0137]|uniref:class I SAM-dependent methyltransferase n=1 Tax=Cronbergia sp. UHCC 0137 TaxID=3110239 RepID=UPI003A4C65A5